MGRSRGRFAVLLAAAALGAAAVRADMVTDWNNVTLDVIRAVPLNPPVATRALAMVHSAVFDAVNGVDRLYEPYAVTQLSPPDASPEAAAAAAAHAVLRQLRPDQAAVLDEALAASLATVPPGSGRNKGVAWGRFVANRILRLRRDDGWDAIVEYTPSGEFGHWQPTPPNFAPALLPNWPYVTPWTMASGDQFRPGAPPAFASQDFATAYNEVLELGRKDSPFRTDDQTEIAYFWEDGAGSVTPPGHWLVIAQGIAGQFGNDLAANARLFALLSIAQADAAIAAWDAKYAYDLVRPISNIQLEADDDGNPDTEADPTWVPEIPTPPFPSYTSGHSTFSAASAGILARFFGSDEIAFCGESPDPERWPDILPGVERCWESFSQAAAEGGQSRIYGGIHWQFDNTAGLASGEALAGWVFDGFLTPLE